jgi:hypothetical protein
MDGGSLDLAAVLPPEYAQALLPMVLSAAPAPESTRWRGSESSPSFRGDANCVHAA